MIGTIELDLIGIGTGNPEHLTLAAVRAMNAADLILLPRKGDRVVDLIDLRRHICASVLSGATRIVEFDLPVRSTGRDYRVTVDDWHAAIAATWVTAIKAHLPGGGRLALLVWGDPSLYDSTIRIARRLQSDGLSIRLRVIPGITSIQALTASHGIPLNIVAEPVLITTGRQLRDGGWPESAHSVVVMLDSGGGYEQLDPRGILIWWGAYLGMPNEALIHGRLADVADRIGASRAELRSRHGWIMDVYLMHRSNKGLGAAAVGCPERDVRVGSHADPAR